MIDLNTLDPVELLGIGVHNGATLRDMDLSKTLADHLHKKFPGWLWAVRADSSVNQGIARIWSPMLSEEYGYILKFASFQDDPSLKRVTEAGGEILERFGFARGPFNQSIYDSRQRGLGKLAFDYQEMKNTKKVKDVDVIRYDHFFK